MIMKSKSKNKVKKWYIIIHYYSKKDRKWNKTKSNK